MTTRVSELPEPQDKNKGQVILDHSNVSNTTVWNYVLTRIYCTILNPLESNALLVFTTIFSLLTTTITILKVYGTEMYTNVFSCLQGSHVFNYDHVFSYIFFNFIPLERIESEYVRATVDYRGQILIYLTTK